MKGRVSLTAALLGLMGALALAVPAFAKGTFDRLLVYGEGQAIPVTDPSLMAFTAFNDFASPYPGTPSLTTAGFLIVRGAIDPTTGEFLPVDTLRFFPTSEGEGSRPFVYYEGLVNGWSEYDHKWYAAKPEAAAALQELLAADRPGPVPQTPSALPLLALSAIMGMVLSAAAITVARRIFR